MRFPLWISLVPFVTLLPQPVAAITVMHRDDARPCYLATLSDAPDAAYRQGLDYCNRAIAGQDGDPDLRAGLLVNRSDLWLKLRDYEHAAADAEAAIALEPRLATAYLNRGAALIGLKRYREALDPLQKAIAFNTGEKLEIAYFNRGLARDYMGDLTGAYFDYKRATEIAPGFGPAQTQLLRFTVTPRPD